MVSQNDNRELISVPDYISSRAEVLGGHGKHIVFVLDMSGSMSHNWSGLVAVYKNYLVHRRQNQSDSDLVSVVQFNSYAETTVNMEPIYKAPHELHFSGGDTSFHPAANNAFKLVTQTPPTHSPTLVFMSDGEAGDASASAGRFAELNRNIRQKNNDSDLELHVIAFGSGASMTQLQQITGSSRMGKLHTSANTAQLSNIFVDITGGSSVADVLEAEIGKRLSDVVSDRLSLEYIA